VLISSVVTYNGAAPVTTRNHNVTTTGFKLGMREEEATDNYHATETISYVAWEPGTGTVDSMNYEVGSQSALNQNWSTIGYGPFASSPYFLADIQTTNGEDTCNLRYKDKTTSSIPIKLDEEQSWDSEKSHADETVGYFSTGGLSFEAAVYTNGE